MFLPSTYEQEAYSNQQLTKEENNILKTDLKLTDCHTYFEENRKAVLDYWILVVYKNMLLPIKMTI